MTISIFQFAIPKALGVIILPKELDHPKKGLINIQNIDDNECFKRCLVRYLQPANHDPARIRTKIL